MNGRHNKNLKAISGSSSIFALSNYTTFSQTQTSATVLFDHNIVRGRQIYFSSEFLNIYWRRENLIEIKSVAK